MAFVKPWRMSCLRSMHLLLSLDSPQLNAWVLGFQPNFPGDLTAEGLSPAQLGGSLDFETTLQRRSTAKQALVKADADRRLRRALLRRYSGTNVMLHPGQDCYYWRDARQPDLVKIRWLGPAKIVLRKDDDEGKPLISHGTQLLRCAPHHVRPDFRSTETTIGGLEEARQALASLKSRGVTRFLDLNRANKRNIEEVDADEDEEMMDDGSDEPAPRRPRLEVHPGDDLDLPGMPAPAAPPSQYELAPQPQPEDLPDDATELPSPREIPQEQPPSNAPVPGDQANEVDLRTEGSQVDGLDFLDQLDRDEPEPGLEQPWCCWSTYFGSWDGCSLWTCWTRGLPFSTKSIWSTRDLDVWAPQTESTSTWTWSTLSTTTVCWNYQVWGERAVLSSLFSFWDWFKCLACWLVGRWSWILSTVSSPVWLLGGEVWLFDSTPCASPFQLVPLREGEGCTNWQELVGSHPSDPRETCQRQLGDCHWRWQPKPVPQEQLDWLHNLPDQRQGSSRTVHVLFFACTESRKRGAHQDDQAAEEGW